MRPELIIVRVDSNNEGTNGILAIDGYSCYSLELPWIDNTPWISCIPEGEYKAICDLSDTKGGVGVIKLLNGQIDGRTDVWIHVANYAGDRNKGYKSEIYGCVAVGSGFDDSEQKKVYPSSPAMKELLSRLPDREFVIKITSMQSIYSKGWSEV